MANLTGLVPFPIWPAHFGGAERCWNVLSRLAPINVHGLSWEGRPIEGWTRGDVTYQVTVAPPAALTQAEKMQAWGFRTYDAMAHMARQYLGDFADTVKADNPSLIVLEHPWLVDFVPRGVPWIYDAHNAEAHHHASRWGDSGPEYANVEDLERRAIQGASLVTACSLADVQILKANYGDFPVMHIPNGVTPPDLAGREPSKVLLFIGSQYPPNVEAAQRLAMLAPALPDWRIVIAGGCSYFVQAPGVELVGGVSDEKLHELFLQAGVFVNLMTSGSGTHLKVGRALSYGVPVVTTQIGKRGYQSPLITDGNRLPELIREVWANYAIHSAEALREASSLSWDEVLQPLQTWMAGRR